MYYFAGMNVSRSGSLNRRLWGYAVSGNYFDMLGVQPLQGRVLHPADDVLRDGHPVAVITYGSWKARFGGDPNVIGSHVKINGLVYTIVGVTPQSFVGTEVLFTPEFFIPLAMTGKWLDDRANLQGWTIGRVRPGVTMKAAESAINSIAAELGREYPKVDEGVS